MIVVSELSGLAKNTLPAKLDALYDALDIKHLRDVLAKNLSGGSKRKLCIALALIYEPEILLLDEPTCGLDPISRRNFCMFLRTLQNTSTIFISQVAVELEQTCDRIIMMNAGKIMDQGTVQELRERLKIGYLLIVEVPAYLLSNDCQHISRRFSSMYSSKSGVSNFRNKRSTIDISA